MKKLFAQLRPLERRLAVGVLVVVIVVLNYWFVWPHRYDWENLKERLKTAQSQQARDEATIKELPKYQALVNGLQSQGGSVPPEDQSIDLLRTIMTQSQSSGVGLVNPGRSSTRTNEFFIEQTQNVNVTGNDGQLVDFLYKLGSSASMIRVRDLELTLDNTRQRLDAAVVLIASYQKNPPAAAPAKTGPKTATAPNK